MRTGKLTALSVSRAKKPGRYGDGGNLHLFVRADGSRAWVLRYQLPGCKPRDMGLGPEPDVTLARARELAREARVLIQAGKDPIAVRRAVTAEAVGNNRAFRDVALEYVAQHEAGWKNPVHRQQWRSTLDTYAFPVVGDLPVATVTVAHVHEVLKPIWAAKTETATRLRGRIERILGYAKVKGWRTGENPARWKDNLDQLLPRPGKVARRKHHPAMPWRECPAFIRRLEGCAGIAPLALRFTMLAAARTGETIEATWGEFDLDERKWTVPPDRMKAGQEHEVPLSDGAMAILRHLLRPDAKPTDWVFPGGRAGKPLSNGAMLRLLGRLDLEIDVTVHGFRSSFKDWSVEETSHRREVSETALAHAVGDKTEAAYRRTKLFRRRIALMREWDDFLAGRTRPTEVNAGQTDDDAA